MELIREFYSEQMIRRKPPCNIVQGDMTLFGNPNYTIKSSALFKIKNARVSSLGIIYKNWKSVKQFIICYEIDFKNYQLRHLIKAVLRYKKISVNSNTKYLILFDNYSGPNGFAHWLCDGMTRIAELNGELKNYTVIFPDYFKEQKIYSETLSFFKFGEIDYLPKESFTKIPELYIPSYIAGTGNFNPKNLEKLRSIILPQIQAVKNSDDFIYISRAKSQKRHIENEKEVVTYLKELNFRIIYCEDYSFQEQVQIMNNAKLVVSIHGAALALLMFMEKGSSVLEFRKKGDAINNMYYSLADAVDLKYYYLNCNYTNIANNANNFDLNVDMGSLKQTLALINATK